MSDDVTPPTWRFSLRGTRADQAIVQRVVEAHAKMGLTISQNDAVLVLIRRAATPDADTQEEARARIERHWANCPHGCTMNTWPPRCPEGWREYDAYQRVIERRQRPPHANPSPPPPPPLPAPVRPERWRAYFGFAQREAS
jgi:hypothetical protein